MLGGGKSGEIPLWEKTCVTVKGRYKSVVR